MNEIKYDSIGKNYNSTRVADPFITQRLYGLLNPENGKHFLDIGCGTGNYTIALTNKGISFTGIDPSNIMLDVARSRSEIVNFLEGHVEMIPFADESFAGVVATLTIHHWKDLKLAFREVCRVLSQDGRIVIFTSTPSQMRGYWLNHYFPQMLQDSIIQMPSVESIKESIAESDLQIESIEKYFIKDELKDHFLYVGKNRPELYLNQQVRNGISSFSSLANAQEIDSGLKKLQDDIKDNRFQAIKARYENDLGDYLFISMVKKMD
jgi:ubiquinone/menaquinone biosynthesis C-methylase UbiE